MPRPSLPMPSDFPKFAAAEGNLRLRKRFNVGGITIERWRKECGLHYISQAMPKRTVTRIIMRKVKRRFQAQEHLEDMDDGFDLEACVRTGGAGGW